MLYIEVKNYKKIMDYCRNELPNEACGLLAGTKNGEKKYIKKIYLLTNTDASRVHFSMNPKEQIEAIKDIRKNGFQLLGNFHSHPESLAEPSREDKRLAYDTKVSYFIVSLMNPEKPMMKAFLINEEKEIIEEEIMIR